MLKVKNLAHLSKKKIEKRREFWPRLQEKSSSARFFVCNLVSRFGLILTKILFSIEWT